MVIVSEAQRSRDSVKLQAALYSAITGSIPEPYYTCPEAALRCAWDDFSTLGICGQFRNITDSVVQNCTSKTFPSHINLGIFEYVTEATCDFWYRGSTEDSVCSSSNPNPISLHYLHSNMFIYKDTIPRSYMDGTAFGITIANTSASIGSIWIVKTMNVTSDFDGESFRTYESYASDFYWCDKAMHGTRTSTRGLTTTSVRTTPWAGMDGLSCSPKDISSPPGLSVAGVEFPYFFNLDNESTYNISGRTYQSMTQFLGSLIGKKLIQDDTGIIIAEPAIPSQGFQLSKFMWANDMETFTHNLADTLTTHMLTPNGDNMNVTTVSGYIISNDTYIQIRWQWLVLPLAETILTCVLLVITIILTRKQPLMKSSTIALLVHGLSGWTAGKLQVPKPETAESLDRLARDITVRLAKDQEGDLKFRREYGDAGCVPNDATRR